MAGQMNAPAQLTVDQIRLCRQQFEMFDLNSDGVINSSELFHVSAALGYRLTKDQVMEILAQGDIDGNGSLSFDEFLQSMGNIIHASSLQERKKAEVRCMFMEYDQDGNGVVNMEEAHKILNKELAFTPRQSIELVRCFDKDGDGHLSYDEFVDFYANVKSQAQQIQAMFVEFDHDKSGAISLDEAQAMLQRLGIPGEEVEILVNSYDKNKDGQLQYEEFVAFLLRS